MSSKPETNFGKQLRDALKLQFGKDVYVQKNHGSIFSSGVPDLFVHLGKPKLGPVYLELKVADGPTWDPAKLTPLQRTCLGEIRASGCAARVVVYFPREHRVLSINADAFVGAEWGRFGVGDVYRFADAVACHWYGARTGECELLMVGWNLPKREAI